MPNLVALIQAQSASGLLSLGFVEVLTILLYFGMIMGIGCYLKRYAKSRNDRFSVGQQPMTAVRTCAPEFGEDC